MHGLRHHFAQTRYEEITGWKAPAAGGPSRRTLTGARGRIDTAARRTIARELGHDRIAVVAQYLGGAEGCRTGTWRCEPRRRKAGSATGVPPTRVAERVTPQLLRLRLGIGQRRPYYAFSITNAGLSDVTAKARASSCRGNRGSPS